MRGQARHRHATHQMGHSTTLDVVSDHVAHIGRCADHRSFAEHVEFLLSDDLVNRRNTDHSRVVTGLVVRFREPLGVAAGGVVQ